MSIPTVEKLIMVVELFMLLMALGIASLRITHQMVRLYKYQSFLLAGATFLTAIEPERLLVMPFLIIPLVLAVSIEPLLAQATVPEDIPIRERLTRLFSREIRAATRLQAAPAWLKHSPARRSAALVLVWNLVLLGIAYMAGFFLANDQASMALGQAAGMANSLQNSLAVALALLMLGLSTMNNRADIISQIMGLLVMEHGLFLAAVRVIDTPSTTMWIVISLFLYIIITLTILVFLLPELRRISGSIQVDDQQQLKG